MRTDPPTDDYERSTRRTTLAALPEADAAPIRERIAASLLTVADDAPVFVTTNRRLRRPGLFMRLTGTADKDAEHRTFLVIGARDLIVVRTGERAGTAVLGARLADLDLGGTRPGVPLPAGHGVHLTGFHVSGPDGGRGTYFVGLGEPDGDDARGALAEAIRRAKAS